MLVGRLDVVLVVFLIVTVDNLDVDTFVSLDVYGIKSLVDAVKKFGIASGRIAHAVESGVVSKDGRICSCFCIYLIAVAFIIL